MNPADAMQILAEGMRLVGLCKLPPVPVHQGTTHESKHASDEAAPASWISQANDALPQLVNWIEDHREVLFAEQPETQEFRLLFTMVYFEQVSQLNEVARFQLTDALDDLDLTSFEDEVDDILTSEGSEAIRHRLFHHYGTSLSLQNWYYRPGETYSFVRMICFLVEYARVKFEPKVISFVLDFGKELLSYRASLDIQILGTILLNVISQQVCRDRNQFENNEELLELLLEMAKKPAKDIADVLEELWDMICYCASSMPGRNPSLDDAVMGILLGRLIDECEREPIVDSNSLYTYVKASLWLLLLNVPEVRIDELDDFTISGRYSSVEEVCKYIKNHFSSTPATTSRPRFTARWRYRIGKVIPRLFRRYGIDSLYYENLQVLLCLVIYPIGAHWYEQRPQACLVNYLLTQLATAVCVTIENLKLDQPSKILLETLGEMDTLNKIYLGYLNIINYSTLELLARFKQETNMVSSTFTEFSNTTVAMTAMINAFRERIEKLRSISSCEHKAA